MVKTVARKTNPTPKVRKILRDNLSGIAKNAIARLLHRAGVLRINSLVYDEIRGVMKMKLETVMRTILTFTEHEKRKTIMEQDVYAAAEQLGTVLVAGLNKKANHTKNLRKCKPEHHSETPKKRKSKPGAVALQKIRKYQKESDCLLIPKENFRRLTLELCQDMTESVRFQREVILLIQLWIENYIVDLCRDANLLALHAGRLTVFPADIQLVRQIRKC